MNNQSLTKSINHHFSTNLLLDWSVTISVNDIDLDPYEHRNLDKTSLAFYIHFGMRLQDVLVLSSGQNSVKV